MEEFQLIEKWDNLDWEHTSDEELAKKIQDLLKAGERAYHSSSDTPMMHAAKYGKVQCIEKLAEAGEDVDEIGTWQPITEGGTALFIAIAAKQLDAVNKLLDLGADANKQAHYTDLPLKLAARVGDLAIINTLLVHGAKVNETGRDENGNGTTALHCAFEAGNFGAAKMLIDAGADINAMWHGQTPLQGYVERLSKEKEDNTRDFRKQQFMQRSGGR